MSEWKMKRFWSEARAEADGDGFTVLLDGRRVKTPAKSALIVPTLPMARAMAAEWDAQKDAVRPETMPVTRAANAAIDKVTAQKGEVAGLIAAYGETDLLCYRAEGPAELTARQAGGWDPLLDWAHEALGARLMVTTGVVHVEQPAEALSRLRAEVDALAPFPLTALYDLVSLSGSLVIGLAAIRGALPGGELWQRSRIDEIWQQEQWGIDEEAVEAAAIKEGAFSQALTFFRLCAD